MKPLLLAALLAVVPSPEAQPVLYVHCLTCPAVEVNTAPEHLIESVSIALCESGHREDAVNPTSGAMGYLQLLPDSAMLRTAAELGYTKDDLLHAGPSIEVAELWRQKTDRGIPWRLWSCAR